MYRSSAGIGAGDYLGMRDGRPAASNRQCPAPNLQYAISNI
jgi:hypothetical protein